jgi:hypothetical protein
MYKIAYDATRKSLYKPGDAVNFFQFGSAVTGSDAALCAEMARLAYVKELARLQDYLARADYEWHWSVGYQDRGTQLFIAKTKLDSGKLKVIVSFRGTEPDDPSDLVADAVLVKTTWFDLAGNPLGEVHKGFANALINDASLGNILAQIKQQLDTLADETAVILLTGHSLGAALATLSASCFNQSPLVEKIHTYTFGCPRVGNKDFASTILANKHDRYVDCSDLVTRIPTESLGFSHGGTLHYIDRNGAITPAAIEDELEDVIAEDRAEATKAYLTHYSWLWGTVWVRELADHSPINYLSAVAGLRA